MEEVLVNKQKLEIVLHSMTNYSIHNMNPSGFWECVYCDGHYAETKEDFSHNKKECPVFKAHYILADIRAKENNE